MIERYTTKVMKGIWSDKNKFNTWKNVEVAVASVMADRNLIPRESFENIPRILIDNGLISESYKVNGTQINNYLAFSHTSALPSTFSDIDINFGNCALFIGASPTDNLYNTYYAGYYEHLYNPNTRIMTAKVNLNPTDINTFKFFDVVTIKNRQYRINKIDYKPNALSTVEFILLN